MTTPILPQIKNVVFLMLENRSLDNLLGWVYQGSRPLNVFPAGSSPDFDGLGLGRFYNPSYVWTREVKKYPVIQVPSNLGADQDRVPAYDPYEEFRAEGWKGVMNQIFGNQNQIPALPPTGASAGMLGFLQDYYAQYMMAWQGLDILWTYTPAQLPAINTLAKIYAVSDRWFCSVPSQTNPNRAYSLCGTSLGRESNANISAVEQFPVPTVFNALAGAGKSWGLYFTDVWKENKSYTEYTFPFITKARGGGETGKIQTFFDRAAQGTLPDFTYLEPAWGYGKGTLFKQGTDYHPPTHVLPGDDFLKRVYLAVRDAPQWNQTLLIITFDEHGGTYDHVAPPWGAINPDGIKGESGFDFNLFGARVPTILVSPFVKNGTVFREPSGSKFPFDHTSFIKTLLLWAGVDPISSGLWKRMPQAPTFEQVLSPDLVNEARPRFAAPLSLSTMAAPMVPGVAEPPPAGAGQPLDAFFEGVSASAARAILATSDTIAQVVDEVAEYKKDPEQFEATLASKY